MVAFGEGSILFPFWSFPIAMALLGNWTKEHPMLISVWSSSLWTVSATAIEERLANRSNSLVTVTYESRWSYRVTAIRKF